MSRRDIIVNTLLGTLLLLVFFARLSAIALAVWFGFRGLDWVLRLVFPNWTLTTESSLFLIWTSIAVRSAAGHARKGRWRNAFLCLVGAPLIGFTWLTRVQSSIGDNGHAVFFFVPVIMVIAVADDTALGRVKFLLTAAVAGAALSVNSGLLGNGLIAHTVADCVLAVTIIWWLATIRNKRKSDSPDPTLALPAAGV